jgi:hypothetical protein
MIHPQTTEYLASIVGYITMVTFIIAALVKLVNKTGVLVRAVVRLRDDFRPRGPRPPRHRQ